MSRRNNREQEAEMQREQEAEMQRKQAIKDAKKNMRTFNIGGIVAQPLDESDESRRARDFSNSRVHNPLKIFTADPEISAPPPSIRRIYSDGFNNTPFLSDSRDIIFSNATHFPNAPVNPIILENAKIIELNKSKMAGAEGGRKKKSRQKKQHRRHRRRHSTRKYKK